MSENHSIQVYLTMYKIISYLRKKGIYIWSPSGESMVLKFERPKNGAVFSGSFKDLDPFVRGMIFQEYSLLSIVDSVHETKSEELSYNIDSLQGLSNLGTVVKDIEKIEAFNKSIDHCQILLRGEFVISSGEADIEFSLFDWTFIYSFSKKSSLFLDKRGKPHKCEKQEFAYHNYVASFGETKI